MELYLRDPDPRACLDVVTAFDPVVEVLNLLPHVCVAVDPVGKLGKRVLLLHMVRETDVRELQPLAPLDLLIGVLADRPAVSQPYAAPPFLLRTAVPPPADLRKLVPFLDVVPLVPS